MNIKGVEAGFILLEDNLGLGKDMDVMTMIEDLYSILEKLGSFKIKRVKKDASPYYVLNIVGDKIKEVLGKRSATRYQPYALSKYIHRRSGGYFNYYTKEKYLYGAFPVLFDDNGQKRVGLLLKYLFYNGNFYKEIPLMPIYHIMKYRDEKFGRKLLNLIGYVMKQTGLEETCMNYYDIPEQKVIDLVKEGFGLTKRRAINIKNYIPLYKTEQWVLKSFYRFFQAEEPYKIPDYQTINNEYFDIEEHETIPVTFGNTLIWDKSRKWKSKGKSYIEPLGKWTFVHPDQKEEILFPHSKSPWFQYQEGALASISEAINSRKFTAFAYHSLPPKEKEKWKLIRPEKHWLNSYYRLR